MERLQIGLATCVSLLLLGGCGVIGTAGLGEEAGSSRLPTGLTLLEADDAECSGIVELEAGVRADTDERRVLPGQNATFELADEDIGWVCLDERFPDAESLDCPRDTTHVRVTRGTGGEEVLFECYG